MFSFAIARRQLSVFLVFKSSKWVVNCSKQSQRVLENQEFPGFDSVLPWQTNRIFFISRCLPIIIFAFSIANEPPVRREKICKKDSVSRQNIRETEPFQKIISLPSFERRSSFKKRGLFNLQHICSQ